MLKGGYFLSESGIGYTVFELTTKNYHRLDICIKDTEFQIEPESVLYSLVRKKRVTKYKGDDKLYKEFMHIKNTIDTANLPIETTSEWVDGEYFKTQTKGEEGKYSRIKTKFNRFEESTYSLGKALVYMFVVQENVTMDIDPLDISAYKTADLDESTVNAKMPYIPYSVLKTRFDLSHIEGRDYGVIESIEEGREYLQECLRADGLVGFDTETDGLEFHLYSDKKLVGVILSKCKDSSRYYPFAHTEFDNLPIEFFKEIEETLAVISNRNIEAPIANLDYKPVGTIDHNNKFDRKVRMKTMMNFAERDGFELGEPHMYDPSIPLYKVPWANYCINHDSMQLSIGCDPSTIGNKHGLKYLVDEITGEKYLEFDDIFLDKKNINFANLDKDTVRVYGCPDGDNPGKVFEAKWKELPKYTRKIYQTEVELSQTKAEQEFWGFRIDEKLFVRGYNTTRKAIDDLEQLIHILTRSNAKLTSSQVLSDILYNKMKCPIYARTNKGAPSTGASALAKLSKEMRSEKLNTIKTDIRDDQGNVIIAADKLNKAKYPVVLLLQKYKDYTKLMSGFYKRVVSESQGRLVLSESTNQLYVDQAKAGKVMRYFSWVNQNGAESGRQSSPMHQLPKEIKACILPDSSEHNLAISDYAQVELRLLFIIAGELKMIEMCRNPDNDIHRAIGSMLTGKEIWEISTAERKAGKARNFGVVYLMSPRGLAEKMFGASPTKEQIKIAAKSIDDFYKAMKKVYIYLKRNREKVLENGYMTTMFGRNRFFREIMDETITSSKRNALIRQANNLPIQGTGADVLKFAENNVKRYIHNMGWDQLVDTPEGKYPLVRMIISAHDEIDLSYHKSIPAEAILKMMRDCMEMQIGGEEGAPLFSGTSIVDNWKEGKDPKFEIPINLRDKLISDFDKTGATVLDSELSHKLAMLNIINKFRDDELVEYMEGLITEANSLNPDDISNLVRHPSLTHELIDRYPQSKEHYREFGELTHNESIKYAVESYLKQRGNAETCEQESITIEEDLDSDIRDSIEEMTQMSDTLYDIDRDGNAIYINDEEDDGYCFTYDDEEDFIDITTSGKTQRVFELFDQFVINMTGLTVSEMQEVINVVYRKYYEKDGAYKVSISIGDKIHDMGFSVNMMDTHCVTELIERRIEVNA